MTNEVFEAMNTWNKAALDAFKKMTETNVALGEKLAKEQIGLVNCMVADCSKALETLTKCKDLEEAVSKQSAFCEETGKKVMKSAKTCADILAKANETYVGLFEENVDVANKTMKTASAPKKAA